MRLPQLDRLFVTDAGLETDLIYNRGVELPCFASIVLLRSDEGRRELEDYFRSYLDLARRLDLGCLLETASWRASPDWAVELGLTQEELDGLNRESVQLICSLRDEYQPESRPVVVSGCIGPRGDGYDPGRLMSAGEAETYHSHQAQLLASAGADLLSAITMTNVEEAIGIAKAAERLGVPVVISFTVETDGRLPTSETLASAVTRTDDATGGYPAYYMINCAHPTHFLSALSEGARWAERIGGVRANASRCSHAELDRMTELDDGDPAELAELYVRLRQILPNLNVIGGCCGTDIRHVTAIAEACSLASKVSAAV